MINDNLQSSRFVPITGKYFKPTRTGIWSSR